MTNKNVIEIIDRLMDSEAEQLVYTASEVFTAIAHGYYFIRPGKNTAKFFEKIDGIFLFWYYYIVGRWYIDESEKCF